MAALFSDGILVLFLFARIHAYVADMEPKCSKFDFEEKLLEKLIKVDHKTGLMMESLEDKLSKVQEELVMVKRELELKGKEFLSTKCNIQNTFLSNFGNVNQQRCILK